MEGGGEEEKREKENKKGIKIPKYLPQSRDCARCFISGSHLIFTKYLQGRQDSVHFTHEAQKGEVMFPQQPRCQRKESSCSLPCRLPASPRIPLLESVLSPGLTSLSVCLSHPHCKSLYGECSSLGLECELMARVSISSKIQTSLKKGHVRSVPVLPANTQ